MTVAREHAASTAMQRGEASRRRLENEGIAIDGSMGFWRSALRGRARTDVSDVSATRCRLQPAAGSRPAVPRGILAFDRHHPYRLIERCCQLSSPPHSRCSSQWRSSPERRSSPQSFSLRLSLRQQTRNAWSATRARRKPTSSARGARIFRWRTAGARDGVMFESGDSAIGGMTASSRLRPSPPRRSRLVHHCSSVSPRRRIAYLATLGSPASEFAISWRTIGVRTR